VTQLSAWVRGGARSVLLRHSDDEAAREVTTFHGDSDTTVTGLKRLGEGRVPAPTRRFPEFGRLRRELRQENEDTLTFNLGSRSGDVGTEISGTLGFVFLDVKISGREDLWT